MTTAYIILSIVSLAISAIAKAVMDLSEEGKLKGNPMFWHKSVSWKNKWKNGDKKQGEKFFGSSRWFVSLTDAWHLAGLVFRFTYPVAFCLITVLTITVHPYFAFGYLIGMVVFVSIFHIFYTYKILRK